jgi:hypothetical protein
VGDGCCVPICGGDELPPPPPPQADTSNATKLMKPQAWVLFMDAPTPCRDRARRHIRMPLMQV